MQVPVQASWRNLKLIKIEHGSGVENGVNFYKFYFKEPYSVVLKEFEKDITRANKEFSKPGGGNAGNLNIVSEKNEDAIILTCDLST